MAEARRIDSNQPTAGACRGALRRNADEAHRIEMPVESGSSHRMCARRANTSGGSPPASALKSEPGRGGTPTRSRALLPSRRHERHLQAEVEGVPREVAVEIEHGSDGNREVPSSQEEETFSPQRRRHAPATRVGPFTVGLVACEARSFLRPAAIRTVDVQREGFADTSKGSGGRPEEYASVGVPLERGILDVEETLSPGPLRYGGRQAIGLLGGDRPAPNTAAHGGDSRGAQQPGGHVTTPS